LFAFVLILAVPSLALAGDFERGVEALNSKNYNLAITCFDACIKENPKDAIAFYNRGLASYNKQEYDKAIQDYSDAIHLDPKYASAFSNRGIATCPKDSLRDGKRAVQLATHTCELSGWKLSGDVDILAAAHAECGDFKEAVKWEKKAIELGYKDKEKAQEAVKRLKLYEEGKPYREE